MMLTLVITNQRYKKIYATNYTASVELAGNINANLIYSGSGSDVIYGGIGNDTIYGGNGNDSIFGEIGKDKLFGDAGNDTLVGGLGNDTSTGGDGADVFVYANGEGEDTILDYVSGQDKIKISSGSISSYSVSGGKDANQITVITSDNKTLTYGGIANGLTFNKADLPKATSATINSNYSGKFDAGAYTSLATINASSRTNAIEVVGNKKANKIQSVSSNDILRGGDGKDTLYGGSGNDSLYGDKDADKLYGDAGNDTLIGGLGDDTLTGGAGNDVFYYSNGDGADVVVDFTANEDKIYISGATSVTGSLSKNDVTFKVGKGRIKVQNAKDKEIKIAYSNGTEKKYVNGILSSSTDTTTGGGGDYNAPTVVLTSSMSSPFRLDDYNKTATTKAVNIDARNLTNSFTIYGNDKNNNIVASKGGSYIFAGKGNDEIYFSDGKDYLYYYNGDGNEIVYNYGNNDEIILDGYANIKSVSLSGNDVILNIGHENSTTVTNTITLKNAKDKYIQTYNWRSSNTAFGSGPDATFGLVNISGNTAVLDANYQGNFDSKWYSAKPANINASAVTRSLTIYADDSDNVIWTGKNYNYVYAGKGNDTIYFGDGKDYLYYYNGDGNEIVYNYDIEDSIYLSSSEAKLSNISYSGNDAILNLTSGNTITIKSAKNTAIRINGYSSGIYNQSNSSTSARVAENYWFAEDDNFVDNNTSMDSIMEENYSVTNIEASEFNSLSNDEFTLTYGSQTEDQK